MKTVAHTASRGITTALIYTRVSSDDQAREGISLDEQLAESRRYCARQEGWLIGGEYTDVMSGKRDDRPDYQRLLADARRLRAEGRRVAVVLKRLDRFGRRVLERVRCREELKVLGVTTHSVSEGGEVSDLVANILASVAEEEVRRLGERVRDARRHVAGNGWRPVGVTRWGYRWRAATEAERAAGAPQMALEIDPETAPYVRETFARVAAGESIHSVTRWIATLPSAARGGRRLYSHSVSRILRAPVYVARQERHDGGDVLEGPVCRWPQLIEDVTWATAQRQIREHTRMPKQTSKRYVLTGLLRCPICRGRMVAWARCVGAPRYRCDRDAAQLGTEGRCRSGVLMHPVDAAVLAEVVGVVNAVASGDAEFRAALRRQWERLRQPAAAADTAAASNTWSRPGTAPASG